MVSLEQSNFTNASTTNSNRQKPPQNLTKLIDPAKPGAITDKITISAKKANTALVKTRKHIKLINTHGTQVADCGGRERRQHDQIFLTDRKHMNFKQTGSAKLIKLAVVLAVCGILAFAVSLLPKGFKDDLSLIGQDSVSVVLVHDKNLVASTKMMELLNKVRSEYEGKVLFLAVDIDTPTGNRFSREQRVGVVDLVIFDGNGERLDVLDGNTSEQALRLALDNSL